MNQRDWFRLENKLQDLVYMITILSFYFAVELFLFKLNENVDTRRSIKHLSKFVESMVWI